MTQTRVSPEKNTHIAYHEEHVQHVMNEKHFPQIIRPAMANSKQKGEGCLPWSSLSRRPRMKMKLRFVESLFYFSPSTWSTSHESARVCLLTSLEEGARQEPVNQNKCEHYKVKSTREWMHFRVWGNKLHGRSTRQAGKQLREKENILVILF